MAEATPLTDDFCDAAATPQDRSSQIYYDPETRGFGLRVTKAGAKSFVIDYRAGRLQRRYTIGSFRDPWKVAAARRRARELKKQIDEGRDPQGERNMARTAPKIADLIERWREEHAPKKRPRSLQQDEYLIMQWIRPELGTSVVADIRSADIEALHRKITIKAGTPYRANRTLALLSKLFSLAVRWEMRPDNPCRGVDRNPEEGRARYLDPGELGRLVAALAEHDDRQGANIIRFLLLTGCRSGEALAARWEQFDLAVGTWTKPSRATKQKKVHRVPLSAPARQLIEAIRQASGGSAFLFPNRGDGHRNSVYASWQRVAKAAQLHGVRVHDLRHSYASYLASSGLSLPVIGALLGHTAEQTTLRYTHLLDDPLRQATERVGAIVTAAELAAEAGAEVVPIATNHRRSQL
jgi:integrase